MAKYDVIVVGAGPGGTAAAKFAAENKLKVLLLERAKIPGQKNMSGSYLFEEHCEEYFPGFKDADFLKDQIRLGGIHFIWSYDNDEKRYGVSMSPGGYALRNMRTVFRNESDVWLADQAVKYGAELKTALVTDVIWADGDEPRVAGVKTDIGDFEAPMVIDASGLHSTLARKTGLTNWGPDKIMLAIKYIYKLDEELIRSRLKTYRDTDGVETDWGAMPTMAGDQPEFWGSHAIGHPERGVINLIIYQTLEELMKARVNIHQRMQWYVEQPPVNSLLEGAEFIYCNFHCLTSGDIVGYPEKAYLPGMVLVGDAGGFAQVVDNFGANVAQYMGKIAGELAAEMKAKNDYSLEMFAEYDKRWEETFIGPDNVPEMNLLMRKGGFQKLVGVLDGAVATFFDERLHNASYPEIVMKVIPQMGPAIPVVLEVPYMMKNIAGYGIEQLSGLMALFGMQQDE